MYGKLLMSKKFLALSLLVLAGWLAPLVATADPLPLPTGSLDTNLFNTNGLVIPPDVQFLLHDLQTNLNQLAPFLAIINGGSVTNTTNNTTQNAPPMPQYQYRSNNTQTNGAPLVYGLGASLENVQTDIHELLPRLAAMVGQTNYSGHGSSVSTNNGATPNRFETTNSPPVQTPQSQRSHTSAKPGVRWVNFSYLFIGQ